MMASEDRVRPFHCGSQVMDWQSGNCCRCKKYSFQTDPATGQTRKPLEDSEVCQIELALFEAYCGNGSVTPEIAKRMGYTGEIPGPYVWQCGEVDWTDEWKRK